MFPLTSSEAETIEDCRGVHECSENGRGSYARPSELVVKANRHFSNAAEPEGAGDCQQFEVDCEPFHEQERKHLSAISERKSLIPTWVSRMSSLKSIRFNCW